MTYKEKKALLAALEDHSPEDIPPLNIPVIEPVRAFTEYGEITKKHFETHYPKFYNYLIHHGQLYDFIFPLQQLL